jgi:hypothetical protein
MRRGDPIDISFENDEARIPTPSYRHAAPSAPWPWVDLSDGEFDSPLAATFSNTLGQLLIPLFVEVDQDQLSSELPPVPPHCDHTFCDGECWKKYPQSRYPNWTRRQVKKSKILKAIEDYDRDRPCKLYYVDVDNQGRFKSATETVVTEQNIVESWNFFVDDVVS